MAEPQTFLQNLLESIERKTANEEVVRGAWHLAVRRKDISALAIVAGAATIPDDVLSAVKARNEIPVAVAYLTREGLSPEERKARLEAEQRAGVLAGVLASASVNEADRLVLAGKLIAKPTRALAEAVIVDQVMTLDAVVVAVAQLDSRLSQLTDTQRAGLRRQIDRLAADPQAATAVCKVINQADLAERLLSRHPELSCEDFSEVFNRVVVPHLERNVDYSRNQINTYRIVGDLRRIVGEEADYHTDIVLESLRKFLDAETLSKVWTEVVGATRAMSDTSEVSDHSRKVHEARVSSDQELLVSLVDEALTGNGALVEPLLRNMNLAQDQLERLAGLIDARTIVRLIEYRPGDLKAALFAYKSSYDRVSQSDKWKAFPDRLSAETEILQHHINQWDHDGSTWYSHHAGMLMSVIGDLQNKDLMGLLPWSFVSAISSRYGMSELYNYVAKMQTEYLGTDMKKWETAEVLSENFTGSMQELYQAAATL